ncbi:MAG TPA: amidase family protein [Dehalococcoidia bacterium]|nr:amidase family protein [Dehalococcoidia bacterium]
MTDDELAYMPATEMAGAIRAKSLSPVEVTRGLLERIGAVNPAINAYVLVTSDLAMKQARDAEAAVMRGDALGSLHGVPVSIKDLLDVEGLRTTKGSLLYGDRIATQTEYSAKRLLQAGGIHLGKTNTPEFGFIPTTENRLFGATRNPWDTTRTPGGSSGGAAAAVAAGLGPIALSSDGGGSIRIPASFCGVFGIKPTYGRVARNPGGWSTMTHRGPTTRTVADAALALDVMAGREPDDPYSVEDYPGSFLGEVDRGIEGRRVAWSADLGYGIVDPEVRSICEQAARRFEDFGCVVEEATPGFANPNADYTFITLAAAGDAVWLGELSEEQWALVDEPAKTFFAYGSKVTGAQYVQANERRMRLWSIMRTFHQTYDLLLTPTLSVTAFPIGEPPKGVGAEEFPPFGWSPFTAPFNLTGQPAASIPCGWSALGLPVGLHVVGRAYEDSLVLRACRTFEQAQPWAQRRPEI